MLTAERAREILDYEPETGILRWKVRRRAGVPAGSEAGALAKLSKMYRLIGIDGRSYLAHRVAWLIAHGAWPQGAIDHRNCDGLDNRLSNLREATPSENVCNRRRGKSNTSGFKGVCFDTNKGRWRAQIQAGCRTHFLGYFDTPEAAHAAYRVGAANHHGAFANDG